MNRDDLTPATWLAIARSRRMQRALAHASLHRHAPLPGLASSLGYMTATTRVSDAAAADDRAALGHRMTVLGVAPGEAVAYIREDISGDDAPIVYRLYLRGPRQGHLVPLHAWYEHADHPAEIHARIAQLVPTLTPTFATAPEAWMLSTRIVQRRALRMTGAASCHERPIRKFALQLVVEPVSHHGPSGRSTVTAFLQPQAQLTGVWSFGLNAAAKGAIHVGDAATCDVAIARVTFTGIPSGTGLSKDTVILLTGSLSDL
ncbi:MAG TPA: hypothetical protein VFP84_13845 [Kofleriaceae bacterium]|nr:hypothetical protein [Kofleriaceae bacterium]